MAGSPEPSELSIVSAPILPPPSGVVATAATVGTGSGSDGLLPPAELPEVLSEAAEDLVFESSEARRVPFLSPLVDERLPRASCKRNNRYVKSLVLTCLVFKRDAFKKASSRFFRLVMNGIFNVNF